MIANARLTIGLINRRIYVLFAARRCLVVLIASKETKRQLFVLVVYKDIISRKTSVSFVVNYRKNAYFVIHRAAANAKPAL